MTQSASWRYRALLAVLLLMLLLLQGRLWFGEGSLRHVLTLEEDVATLEAENATLRARNELMAADVRDLKEGLDAVEEVARKDLGMVREGETFFIMVDGEHE